MNRKRGNKMAQSKYEVGDVIKMKKKHPCGSFEWGDSARGSGLSTEMSGVRTSDYDCQENRGKKIQKKYAKKT